ncbi:MAG: DUF4838 domain-containing protein, partial [Planctomycetaceae bacterium]|nr:DUF4838 domain-containing protein [Planctomycetaceae bacterium]
WDYTVNFQAYMLPHPNHRVLAPNVRFFVDNKTIGLFEQGDTWCATGDFVRLKTWLLSHLMWNPDADENKLTDEFITGYYGKYAAPFVKEYWKLLLDRVEASGVYLGCYQSKTGHWLDAETLIKAGTALDTAYRNEKDETIKKRLWREKIPLDLVLLQRYHELKRKNLLPENSPLVPNNPLELVDDFQKRCNEFKAVSYNEGDNGDNLKRIIEGFRQRLTIIDAPAPEFCKDLPKDRWFDVRNYEFSTAQLGVWTFIVDDAKAATGKTVKMPSNHYEWATSYTFDSGSLFELKSEKEKDAPPTYKIYASVRCEASADDGAAMTVGIYDYGQKKGVTSKTIPVSEIKGKEYKWISLGSVPLLSGAEHSYNFWFAPAKRPEEVDAVYIDRIVVVRE